MLDLTAAKLPNDIRATLQWQAVEEGTSWFGYIEEPALPSRTC